MSGIASMANELLLEFNQLPTLTQWAVTILICSGVFVHIFTYNQKTAHDAPSIFTTAGIFFTFIGIAEGLLKFDANSIEASVPALLSGLKTAFVASIVGIFIALTIKLRSALIGLPKGSKAVDVQGATVDDLFNQMVAVQQSLVGEDDSTLLSQIKLSRQDSNDRLDSLRKSQTEFMTKMADNNSKALIQALQEVIRDFNTKINEQFGENFKQLNNAVGQMLEWQKSYRSQLSELIQQQSKTAQDMQLATGRYSEIVSKAEQFSAVSSQLGTLLINLNEQRTQIEASLKSLAQVLTAASGSLPQVEKKILELTQQMTLGVKNNQEEVSKTLREGSAALQSMVGDIKKLMLEATQSANQEVNAHIKQLSEKNSEQIVKLDAALERELTKAISTLGSQLTALSKRFVDDYQPLTESLRAVVRSAGGV
jgi:hypothetical protein